MSYRAHWFLRFARGASGAVAVEFALMLPVYIVFVLGVMEFGRWIWIRNTMEMAAESAARYGAITSGATDASIETQAATYLIGIAPASVTFNATACASNVVTVNATHNFTPLAATFVPIPAAAISVTATIAC